MFLVITSESKKTGQIAVLIHYWDLSRFFWLRRYKPLCSINLSSCKKRIHEMITALHYKPLYNINRSEIWGKKDTNHGFHVYHNMMFAWWLKYGFLKKLHHDKCTSCHLTLFSHHFWVGFLLHPPKSDGWKWSTDKSVFITKWLCKKSIL